MISVGKSVSRNSAFNMVNKGLSVVFPLVTVSYISRVLGPSGIGEVSSAQNLATYFSMAAALGMPSYGVRAIAQSRENSGVCNKVFSELFVINFISTFLSTVLYLIALFFLKDKYSNTLLTLIFSSIVIFNVINIEWVYQGFEEYEYITIRSLIVKLISLLLLFVFVRQKDDLIEYAAVICFGSVGNYLFNFYNLKKYVKLQLQGISLKRHVVPIMNFFVSVVAIEIYSLLDISMLTAMTDPTCVGYYSNSTRIVKAAANTLMGLSAVLMPRFSCLFAENNKNEIKKLSAQFLNLTFLISMPACIGIILIADQIVGVLFGAGFEPAIATIRILSPLIVLMPLSGGVFCQLLLTSGHEKRYLLCVLSGTFINAALNCIFIPFFAQNGAAVASVIAELSVSSAMIVASRSIVKVNINHKDYISVVLSSGIMAAAVFIIRHINLNLPVWINLILEITISAVVYFVCAFLMGNSIFGRITSAMRHKKQ